MQLSTDLEIAGLLTRISLNSEGLIYSTLLRITSDNLKVSNENFSTIYSNNIEISTEILNTVIIFELIKTVVNLNLSNEDLELLLHPFGEKIYTQLHFSPFIDWDFDPNSIWIPLASNSSNQINISHLTSALTNYVTFEDLEELIPSPSININVINDWGLAITSEDVLGATLGYYLKEEQIRIEGKIDDLFYFANNTTTSRYPLNVNGDLNVFNNIHATGGVSAGGIGDLAETTGGGYNLISTTGSGNAVTSVDDNTGSTLKIHKDITFAVASDVTNYLATKVDKVTGYGLSKNDLSDALLQSINNIITDVYTKTYIDNNFVPYVGALKDVNLGDYSLSLFNLNASNNIHAEGGVSAGGIGDLSEAITSGYNDILPYPNDMGNAVTSITSNGDSTLYYRRLKSFSEVGHNHDTVYSLLEHVHDDRYYTEVEISNILSGLTSATGYNKSNWDTAYGWGNHNSAGYAAATALSSHIANVDNPHSVTKAQVGLDNVEDTKLSTWAGTANITTLGTISSGTWNATTIEVSKGGTGKTSIAIDRMLYASSANTYSEVITTSFGRGILSAISGTEVAGLRAATATKLASPVYLWGNSFDGSASINGGIESIGNIHTTQRIYGDAGVFSGGIGDLGEFGSSGYNSIVHFGTGNVITSINENGSTLEAHKDLSVYSQSQVNGLISTEVANRNTAISDAINLLDVASVGGAGKYISAISETNGKISATSGTLPTQLSQFTDNLGSSPVHTHSQYMLASLKGTANGLAELDNNGLVPASQLPSYVDDVLTYSSLSAFPATGIDGKIYIASDTNLTYRWSGTAYVEISKSLALGETISTAYRGDRGKIAYDHSQASHTFSIAGQNINALGGSISKASLLSALNVADGAQVNVLEGVKINGTDLTISSKAVNVNACTSITVPTGLSVASLSASGLIAISLATGYAIPTSVNIAQIATNATNITTLQGYFTDGSAKSAIKLLNERTLWGRSFDGTANVSGNMTGVGSLDASGDIRTSERIYGAKGIFSGGIGDLAESGSSGYNQILLQGTGNAVTSISDNGGSTLYYNRNKTFSEASDVANSLATKVDKVAGYGLSKNDLSDTLLSALNANTSARHSHSNKALLDTYAQTESNLASAVSLKHTHSNKAVLDDTTASFLTADRTKLDGIADNANNYSLPIASSIVLGGIKVGSRLTITSGVLSADVQSDYNFNSTYKTKLDGIAANANLYVHPSYTAYASGLYKVVVNSLGHVTAAVAVAKSDITGLGIPAQDTVYTHPSSGVTAGTYRSVTVNANGHVTAGTNPTTIADYGITDAKIVSGVITLGAATITPLVTHQAIYGLTIKKNGTQVGNVYTPNSASAIIDITDVASASALDTVQGYFTSGSAKTALKLTTAVAINGTNFDGSASITTTKWGTARSIGIINSDGSGTAITVSVDGSNNINLKLPASIKAALEGNASTASAFQSAKSVTLTGDITGTASSTGGWSIATAIGAGKVTNDMLAGSIDNSKLSNSLITIAGTEVSLGSSLDQSTLRTGLGLQVRNATMNSATYQFLAYDVYGTTSFAVYAPTAAGTSGQLLISTGGTPSWVSQGAGGGIDADKLDNMHAVDFVNVASAQTITGAKTFSASTSFLSSISVANKINAGGIIQGVGGVFAGGIADLGGSEYAIPTASASSIGGIKIGYTNNAKNYKVALDASGNAFVNVPWINTAYSEGNYIFISGATINNAGTWYLEESAQNGYITVVGGQNPSGYDIPVHGLGSAAYTNSSAYASSSHNHSGVYEPVIATKNTAFNVNFGTASGTACQGNDSRLSNARTPLSHTHAISDVTGLQTALDGKQVAGSYAAASHTHTKSQITDFPTTWAWGSLTGIPSTFAPSAHTLDSHSNVTITSNSSGEILKWNGSAWINNTLAEAGIAAASHTHTKSQITDFPTSMPASDVSAWAKASSKPSYTYSEVGAAAASHTHTKSQITDFPTSMPASDVSAWAKASSKPSYTYSEVGAAAASHTHTKSQITDFPTSMPASDVSAWAKAGTKPSYTYSEVGAAAASHNHTTFDGNYTSNGGLQNPNYFGVNKVGALMMNTGINGNYQFKDFLFMDCYSGSDVGGAVAIGIGRQNLGVYIMRSAATRTAWAESAELLGTHNWGSYCAAASHTHTKSQITDFPTSMPASDVSAWAKAATKPSYTYSEVGAAAASHSHAYASTVKLGTVAYAASSNIISLPAYPTTLPASDVSAWAKASTKPSYTYSEVGAAASSHNHSGVYEPVIATKNTAFNVNFGTASGTACQGNDLRLYNARTPSAHTHSEYLSEGSWTTPTLTNATQGTTYGAVRYRKIGTNVQIDGSFTVTISNTNGLNIFQLNTGYIPVHNMSMLLYNNSGGIWRCIIGTDGKVSVSYIYKISDGSLITTATMCMFDKCIFPIN